MNEENNLQRVMQTEVYEYFSIHAKVNLVPAVVYKYEAQQAVEEKEEEEEQEGGWCHQ